MKVQTVNQCEHSELQPKVLLLSPAFPDLFWWGFKDLLALLGQKAILPPLGVLTVAALLPGHWQKRLVDLNVQELTPADLTWADYVFIGAMLVQRESARHVIKRCKAAGRSVVAGGPLFTSEYEKFPDVDYFVLDEAELTLPAFLADLERGAAQRVYRASGFADLTTTPIPCWELAELRRYHLACVQYSRGCPHDCEFCNVTTLYGQRPRLKNTDQILAELDTLYHGRGWRGGLFFVDDNLIANRKRLKEELLPALIRWREGKVGVPFNTQVSIDLADDQELMQLLYAAGFDTVFIGIESPEETALAECCKTTNRRRDFPADIRRIQQAGLQVQGGFVVGFDSDTTEIFQRQFEFIQAGGVVTAMVSLLQAYPGTRLEARLRQEGRLRDELSGDNVLAVTNVVTRMDERLLIDGYIDLMRRLYAPQNYYARLRTFLGRFRAPVARVPLTARRLLFVVRSLLVMGIEGEERKEYWKLLAWVLRKRPELLFQANIMAFTGRHFRKVCEVRLTSGTDNAACSAEAHQP